MFCILFCFQLSIFFFTFLIFVLLLSFCFVSFLIEVASERSHLFQKITYAKKNRRRITQTTRKKLETKKARLQVNGQQQGKKVEIQEDLL